MNSTVMTIFTQLTSQYTNSIANIHAGSIVLGKELFYAIALLSVGLLGINRLLNKNVDMAGANIELIRWLMYLNVFYLLMTNDQLLPLIINSFQQAGAYLGAQASSTYVMPTPAGIINNGFNIALKIIGIGLKQTLLLNFGMTLVTVIAVVVILYCFGMIAVELLLIQIGSQIILAVGIFLLAFSGLEWTREYAMHYVNTNFHIGIKMLIMYVLIGIGAGLTNNWAHTMDNIPFNQTLQYNFAIVMATFVFYMLCKKLPEQAAVYLTGRMSINYEAIPSLPDVVKGSFSMGKKVGEIATGIKAGIQGDAKANSAARQAATASFTAQGKTPTPQDIQMESVKTLGEARKAMKQADWDKVVDATQDGKVAKSILDSIPKSEDDAKTDGIGHS